MLVSFFLQIIAVVLFIFLIIWLMKGAKNPRGILKMIYLYILAFVGIIISVVASIGMIDLVLKQYVFQVDNYGTYYVGDVCRQPKNVDGTVTVQPSQTEIDQCIKDQEARVKSDNANQVKRDLSSQIAGLLIGLPLWLYHWGIIKKEKEEDVEEVIPVQKKVPAAKKR